MSFKKIHTKDGVLNRIQDQLAALLNPLLQDAARVPAVFTRATTPTPGVEWRGKFILVKDQGKPEELWTCVSTSSGRYEWRACAVASS